MTVLTFASIAAWAACWLSLAAVIALMGASAWTNRHAAARLRNRSQYIEMLKGGAVLPVAQGKAADAVLTDLAVDLLGLVCGKEEARFAELAARAGVAERLKLRLRAHRARRRLPAAAALGSFSDEDSRVALLTALNDRNRHVRLTAAMSLAKRAQAPPPAPLVQMLGIGDHETSTLCVVLLAELAKPDVGRVRSLLLDPETLPAVKLFAAEALAMSHDFGAVPAISRLAADADPWAAELPRYVGALGDLGNPQAIDAVLHCIDSVSPEVRAAAARASGRMGKMAAIDLLDGLLDDPVWQVRFESAHALMALGEPGRNRLASDDLKTRPLAWEAATLTLAEHAAVR